MAAWQMGLKTTYYLRSMGASSIEKSTININKKYEDRLANLGKEKIKVVSIGFLFWLVPVILVYVLGLAAGWIYRGFRQT